MGTLQSELSKIGTLDNLKFDDDPQDRAEPAVVVEEEGKSQRRLIWEWLKDHPGSTNRQIAEGSGQTKKFVATAMHHFHRKGVVSRKMIGDLYHFTATTDKYPAMSNAERARVMLAARKYNSKTKPKAAKKARVTQDAPVSTPQAPLPVVNSIDDILNHLSVVQARELYDKLRKIFGGTS